MAAVGSKRKHSLVDYKNLNALSSVVLYDTARKVKGKFFEVDRLIEKRKVGHNKEYLVKWTGWPMHACSWEPEDHLTPDLLRTYEKPPKPNSYQLELAGRHFYHAMLTSVKGKSAAPVDVQIDFDVQRYL
ncbi:La ribonucleoprotein [Desmophyllum pertusum]|uniref:La ribonucleoprotein n=1 Tax=Desmophyllum pertusum TaxID=174260 RepID=A0A9W9ZVP5_9CNID|nr:La ribonucleoprotein [Desmophyllum pertusum]